MFFLCVRILINLLLLLNYFRIVPFSPPVSRMVFLGPKGNYVLSACQFAFYIFET